MYKLEYNANATIAKSTFRVLWDGEKLTFEDSESLVEFFANSVVLSHELTHSFSLVPSPKRPKE